MSAPTRIDQELFLIIAPHVTLLAAVIVGLSITWGAHQVSQSLMSVCPEPEGITFIES